LARLFDQYLETRSADSPKHQQSLRYTKERLQRLHARKVSTLTKEEIEDAFWKLPPASFNAHGALWVPTDLLVKSGSIEVGLIRGNLVAPNLKDGSPLDGDASSCGRPVSAFAGIAAGQ
jgi:hypothetical protein